MNLILAALNIQALLPESWLDVLFKVFIGGKNKFK
jgi:hypothetical protein